MQVPSLADAHVLVQTGGAKRRRRGGEAEAEAEAAAAVAVVFERAPGGRHEHPPTRRRARGYSAQATTQVEEESTRRRC